MSEYLVVEWGRAGLRCLAAEITGETVRVQRRFSYDVSTDVDAASDPEAVGRWLKTQLAVLGRGERRLIALVSREDVVLRLMTLPAAGDEAVADLVRYQTGARSSVPLDQLALDYLPLGSQPPQGGRWVQTATVPRRTLNQIKACASVAGLDLFAVGITTLSLGELISQAERLRGRSAAPQQLTIRVVGEQLEVALWRGTDLLFGHAARAADPRAASVEVQRALMGHQAIVGDAGIDRAWLLASTNMATELQTELAARLGCEVLVFDPSQDLPANVRTDEILDDGADVAAALGTLLAQVRPTVPTMNFLQPRRRAVKPNRTQRLVIMAGVLLVLLLPGSYLTTQAYLKSLGGRIAKKQEVVRQQDESLAAGEPTRETAAFLASWEASRVNWLAQMQRISAALPGTERVYLDRWRFEETAGEALGTTEAVGFSRQRQDAEQLTQRLAEQPGFRIQPNPLEAGGNDADYPILFQLDAELFPATRQRPVRNERE